MSQFLQHVTDLGFVLTAVQQQQFADYLALLLTWNQQMNLTAVREPADIEQRHFLDSLTCTAVTGDLNGRALIDVGTGAGFPGLPLKILFPDLRLTLVESIAKKTRFLEEVVSALCLPDVEIVVERVELLGQQSTHRAQYDWAVARGVAEMRVLAEYLLPLCVVGGHLLAQKGKNAQAETAVAQNAVQMLGGGIPQLHQVQLPDKTTPHYLVVIEKIKPTPQLYPRRVGMPAKRPL